MEIPDDKLTAMPFKQGLYVHSHMCRKLKKRKHDYAMLAECFKNTDDGTSWDDEAWKKGSKLNEKGSPNRTWIGVMLFCHLPPHLNNKKERKYQSTSSKLRQLTTLNTSIKNILHGIKDKPHLKRLKPLLEHMVKVWSNKYNSFHQRTRHTTRNCPMLQ